MSEKKNVTSAKPKVGGAAYVAPLGTDLPTDAKTALDSAFKALGYISEDGLTNSNSPETEETSAWGGEVVLEGQTSRKDSFQFKLIEALNVDVLKTVYGSENVTGDLTTGITIKATNDELEQFIWVFEMILKGGVLKRVVVPCAAISEVGDINYKDNEPVGYDCTISAIFDNGASHYEYMIKKGE